MGLLADDRRGCRAKLASNLPPRDSSATAPLPVVIGKVICEFSYSNREQEGVRVSVVAAEKSRRRVLFCDSKRKAFISDEP